MTKSKNILHRFYWVGNFKSTPRPRTAPLRPAMTRRNDPDLSETVALILMGAASLYLCVRIIPTLLFMWEVL